jgi:ubiquinone/menaquinone biosynthesis C-methylase UbiE
MKVIRWAGKLKQSLARGIFPHELSFFLELPWRNIVLSPEALAARLSLTNNSYVLEVGAGSGFYSPTIADRTPEGRLAVLDLQAEMLKKARRKLNSKGLSNVSYALADASRLPFKEQSFDVVFLVAVLGEIADRKSFLGEARRVLKPGGLLSISEHLPDPDFSTSSKIRLIVEREGFEFSRLYGRRWAYTMNFRKSEQ